MASNDSETTTARALVDQVNELLVAVNVSTRVKTPEDINAILFVKLLEYLCGDKLSGVIRKPKTRDDDVHNVKIVLKTLSESLKISLSYIKPEEIVAGDVKSIGSLVEIFAGLIEGQTSEGKSDEALVQLANSILQKAEANWRVNDFNDIGSMFFVKLLDGLCKDTIEGILPSPKSEKEEEQNVEAVLEILEDVLGASMSHISAKDIVSHKNIAISNLLEVFAGFVDDLLAHEAAVEEETGKRSKNNGTEPKIDGELVNLANDLLSMCKLDGTRVKSRQDLSATFFVQLLESVCGESMTAVIHNPKSAKDDLENMTLVIKTLSGALKVSLSHIIPREVIAGDPDSIRNLLQIFQELLSVRTEEVDPDDAAVKLANDLLSKAKLSQRVKSFQDITAEFFVTLLEQLCPETTSRAVQKPKNNLHKLKVVIETLSDVLKISLSHISPKEVNSGNRVAVKHLLEVFYGLLEGQETKSKKPKIVNDDATVNLANELLEQIRCDMKHIETLKDINASFFMTLLEHFCSEDTSDFIRPARSREDDIHNVRVVINRLSDQLKTPLSHISSREVVLGNRVAIGHLLEVFYELIKDFNVLRVQSKDDDDGLVNLANEMLSRLRINLKVRSISEINAGVFVTLFEGLCAETLPGIIQHPKTKQDEIRNVDTVIEALSIDILNTSLSHITGRDIVNGNQTAIGNLLEVFYGLMEFILEEIRDDSKSKGLDKDDDDPDRVNADVIDDILGPQLRKSGTHASDKTAISNGYSEKTQRARSVRGEMSQPLGAEHDRHWSRDMDKLSTQDYADARHVSNGHPSTTGYRFLPSTDLENDENAPTLLNHDKERHQSIRMHEKVFSRNLTETGPVINGSRNERPFSDVSKDRKDTELQSIHERKSATLDADLPKGKIVSFSRLDPQWYDYELRGRTDVEKCSSTDLSDRPSQKESDQSIRPETYQDYLMKYYGRTSRYATEDAYLSDGCVDYECGSDSSGPTSYQKELDRCRQDLEKRAKAVRFDDYLDDCATGMVGELRRQFKDENKAVLLRKELLGKTYHDELLDLEEETLCNTKKASRDKDKEFRKQIFKPPQTSRYRTNKYSVPSSVLLPRSRSSRRSFSRNRKRSSSASPTVGRQGPVKMDNNDILPQLLEEFPHLHLTRATLNNMYRKATQQMEHLSCPDDVHRRKNKAQEQIEEAERRQRALLGIMQKDLIHQQRMREAKDRQRHQMAVKSKIRDKRLQSARIRKYYDEFHVRQRSKMLKKRTKEELLFKNLLHDGLDIQRDRIREIKKYAKEQRELRAKQQKLELESLENFYRDQFALLAESLENERCNSTIREKAQMKVLEQMKHEMRKKMENEIRDFQQRLLRDEDDIYFRELDAERIQRELCLARYCDKI